MKIGDVMSPCAYTIESTAILEQGRSLMDLYAIRHLPVVEENDVIGILSERDVVLASSMQAASQANLTCGEACSPKFVIVTVTEEVVEVVEQMSRLKIDCVLVSDDKEKFVGIFTTTDVCRLLILALEERQNL